MLESFLKISTATTPTTQGAPENKLSPLYFDKIKTLPTSSVEDWIDTYVEFLRSIGVKVVLNHNFEYDFVGECSYSDATIRIGKIPPDQALLALAHETGHWVSHLRLKHSGLTATTYEREIWAFLYGWYVIKNLGAQEIIPKTTWKNYHENEMKAYAAYKTREENK